MAKNFQSKISKALSIFEKTKKDLEAIVDEMGQQKSDNDIILKSIEDENKQLSSSISKTNKTISKIADIIE